jgi:hypothetical protein
MPTPTFVGAGSGTVVTTGTGTVTKTGCKAGNLLILDLYEDQAAQERTRSNRVNIEALNGVDNADTIYQSGLSVGNPQIGNYTLFMGRVMADGTCSWDVTVGASGADLSGLIYEFSGVSTGTTITQVGENVGGSGGGSWRQLADTDTDLLAPDVVTSGNRELAVAFVHLRGAQSLGDFTGETGGDWTEAVAEYSHSTGNGATLQLQTASMLTAGTLTGGTITITSASWGVVALALIPSSTSDNASIAWITA